MHQNPGRPDLTQELFMACLNPWLFSGEKHHYYFTKEPFRKLPLPKTPMKIAIPKGKPHSSHHDLRGYVMLVLGSITSVESIGLPVLFGHPHYSILFCFFVKGRRDYITPYKAIYTWYNSGIYCQLGDCKLPTPFSKN